MKNTYNHIALIHRDELNILLKKGYILVNKYNVSIGETDEDILQLLNNSSPFEYTSEYIFVRFRSSKKNLPTKCEELEYKDVISVIPLDLSAKRELEISLNKSIVLSMPLWTRVVEDYLQVLLCKNMGKGGIACLEIFGCDKPKDFKIINSEIEDDFKEKTSNLLLHKESLNEKYSLWVYLFMYDRYEPYPKNVLGYFYDSLHVFINFVTHQSLPEMPNTSALKVLQRITNELELKFEDVVSLLETSPESRSYVEKNTINNIRRYVVMPLFFLLKNVISSNDIRSKNRLNAIKAKYKNEFVLALYLVGLRLGYSSIYELCCKEIKKNK